MVFSTGFIALFKIYFDKVVRHHWLGVVGVFSVDLKPVLSATLCKKNY